MLLQVMGGTRSFKHDSKRRTRCRAGRTRSPGPPRIQAISKASEILPSRCAYTLKPSSTKGRDGTCHRSTLGISGIHGPRRFPRGDADRGGAAVESATTRQRGSVQEAV
eukprot:3920411-Pyramimonas_sp.AAC.1